MTYKRKRLLERNREIISFPMPDLESMTDQQLEKRATMMEEAFRDAFAEDEEDDDCDI